MTAKRLRFDDGRWHLQHGPIDLIIGADGDAASVQAAHDACWTRFVSVLDELVGELAQLRAAIPHAARVEDCPCEGAIARRMWHACFAHRERFITPMAAVAGSVADELIGVYAREGIARAYINNGGDIALHLARDDAAAHYTVGVFADLARFDLSDALAVEAIDAHITLDAAQSVRGIATSGWRGRSFSLGIADSVTVLARDAATADAAATIIANAVYLHEDEARVARIVRQPASSLKDNSDLGDMLVTVDVPALPVASIELALDRGVAQAERLRAQGIIEGAALFLQHRARSVGAARSASNPLRAPGGKGAALTHITEAPCSKYAAC